LDLVLSISLDDRNVPFLDKDADRYEKFTGAISEAIASSIADVDADMVHVTDISETINTSDRHLRASATIASSHSAVVVVGYEIIAPEGTSLPALAEESIDATVLSSAINTLLQSRGVSGVEVKSVTVNALVPTLVGTTTALFEILSAGARHEAPTCFLLALTVMVLCLAEIGRP